MDYFLKSLISGILTGLFYCLISYGFSLTYRLSHIINFAHGCFIITGGYISWLFWNDYKINPFYSIFFIIPLNLITGFIFCMPILRFKTHRETLSLIITLGMALLIQGLIIMLFGADYRVMEGSQIIDPIFIGNFIIPGEMIIATLSSLITLGISFLIYRFTYTGKVLRAISMERLGAQISGINIYYYEITAFLISASVAGCTGILVPMIHYLNPHMIIELTVISLIISLPVESDEGLLIAGLILGVSQSLIISYLGIQWREFFIYFTLLCIIIIKTRSLWQRFQPSFS